MFVCHVCFKLFFITNPDITHAAPMSDYSMNSFHVIPNIVLPGSFEVTQVTTMGFFVFFFRFIREVILSFMVFLLNELPCALPS